jgi:Xaa-Pro aminopeptidase
LASLAREAYEIGVKTIRPGITYGQLAEAMGEPNRREGTWHLSPLAHSLNPHEAVTNVTEGIRGPRGFTGVNERFGDIELPGHDMEHGDLVIQEGMLFELEPNSCYGRTYVNIGGNILVTKDGCEELNNIPTRMVVVPA